MGPIPLPKMLRNILVHTKLGGKLCFDILDSGESPNSKLIGL